jgi:biotin transport system substrate-specific component
MVEAKTGSLSRYVTLGSDHIIAQAFWVLSFALLTAVGAQIEIPHYPVPYTMQTFFVLLAGGLLGKRKALLSMLVYIGIGAAGLPVFSSASAGLPRLLGPTGGYLIGFPLAAYLIGSILSRKPAIKESVNGRIKQLVAVYGWGLGAMSLGLICIFLMGTLQLNAVYYHNWTSSFNSGFLIFSWWDVLKLVAATAIWKELSRS